MRFINFERTKLPNEILKHNIEEKKRYFAEINLEVERSDAEIQVYFPSTLLKVILKDIDFNRLIDFY